MKFKKYDIIIIGSGISGLYTALNLDDSFKVLMLSKRAMILCNSALAQGGVAAVIDKSNDDFCLHVEDSLVAGGYENNLNNLKILVRRGPDEIENLISFGVNFDRKIDGGIDLTLEGGHSRNRIVHHKDSTGFEIVSTLIERVKTKKNVTILENSQVLNIINREGEFLTEVFCKGEYSYYAAKTCVIATGGIGRVYDFTTNANVATGEGIYFADKLGAKIENLSLIQFHPTAFAGEPQRERFLISESVRGEGAYLLNCDKKRFMLEYEPERKELAPRDVVSRCILQEEKRTNSGKFYLDISYKDSVYIIERFPMIYKRLLENGYDMTREPIPVYPCQHYLMGGITVDENGRTTIKNLYAAGECAHTGIHGKNRLASNSLLEALVFSRIVAQNINETVIADKSSEKVITNADYPSANGVNFPHTIRNEIKSIMQKSYFVVPNLSECLKNLPRIAEIYDILETGNFTRTPDLIETKSLATIAKIILNELLERNS